MQAITDLIMYFHKGGLVMWPLLACSVTVIAIAIERFIYYKSVDSGAAFAARYCTAVRSGDFAVATELARKGSGQCAQMLADARAPSSKAVPVFLWRRCAISWITWALS